jgi:flagellar protein FlbD
MITLTRINGTPIVVNADLIENLEATPDTVLSLATNKRIIVRETIQEVVDAVIRYRQVVAPACWCLKGFLGLRGGFEEA